MRWTSSSCPALRAARRSCTAVSVPEAPAPITATRQGARERSVTRSTDEVIYKVYRISRESGGQGKKAVAWDLGGRMKRQGDPRKRMSFAVIAALLLAALAATLGTGAATAQSPLPGGLGGSTAKDNPPPSDTGDLPVDPAWLANTLTRASTTSSVQNNLAPGAIDNRNQALTAWRDANAAAKAGKRKPPSPLARP